MSLPRQSSRYTVLAAKATDGVGIPVNVADFQHVLIAVATAATSTLTVKVQGAIENPVPVSVGIPNVPDFSAAASATNFWTYLHSFDLLSNTGVAGGTGYAVSASTIFKTVKVNTSGLDWLSLEVSGRSGGSASAWVVGYTNA